MAKNKIGSTKKNDLRHVRSGEAITVKPEELEKVINVVCTDNISLIDLLRNPEAVGIKPKKRSRGKETW